MAVTHGQEIDFVSHPGWLMDANGGSEYILKYLSPKDNSENDRSGRAGAIANSRQNTKTPVPTRGYSARYTGEPAGRLPYDWFCFVLL